MPIVRGDKTELALKNAQVTACKRHAGAARVAATGALQRKQEADQAPTHRPSAVDLHRERNARKGAELRGLYAGSKCAPQEALRHLDAAFARSRAFPNLPFLLY